MLSPAQRKRLADLDSEWIQVCEERMQYTHDYSRRGIAEWDRLWARYLEIAKERKKLLGEDTNAPVAQELSQAQA